MIRDPFNVSGLALLDKYPTAKHYTNASVERILKTFRGIKGNNFNRDKAQALLDALRRTIYMNYRSKGRAKKEAIIIVARKLLTIIYTIYTRNIPYDPQRVFVAKPNQ